MLLTVSLFKCPLHYLYLNRKRNTNWLTISHVGYNGIELIPINLRNPLSVHYKESYSIKINWQLMSVLPHLQFNCHFIIYFVSCCELVLLPFVPDITPLNRMTMHVCKLNVFYMLQVIVSLNTGLFQKTPFMVQGVYSEIYGHKACFCSI